jgi:hypothetical protein
MFRIAPVLLVLFSLPVAGYAQTAISGAADCAKPQPSYSVEVGDRPGHILGLQRASCTWTTPVEIAGSRTTTGEDVSTLDAYGTLIGERGYHTATLANGTKFTVRYQGTVRPNKNGSASMRGTWTFVGGTGGLRGIKGGGTYSGTGAVDGSGHINVRGRYQLLAKK